MKINEIKDEFSLSNLIDIKIEIKWNKISKISSFNSKKDFDTLRAKYNILADSSTTSITYCKQNKFLIPPYVLSDFETMYLFQNKAIDIIENYEDFLNYFKNNSEDMKYMVYCDLKKKKYWVLSGISYGVDFMAYVDDPNFVHSETLIQCFKKEEDFNINTIISNERVAGGAKKKIIFAFYEEGKDIEYINLSWINY